MPSNKGNDGTNDAAKLSSKARNTFSQVVQDIRTTVSHLNLPGVSPLAVLDATAVDAIKDLYYIVNIEDPLNAMPARKLFFEQRLVNTLLLPLVAAVHDDPASQGNQKRWSVPMYQALRLLSVLSIPIAKDNEFLKPGCSMDSYLLKLRMEFALNRTAMAGFVALLQYYIGRKVDKQSEFALAEDCKLEDARIDNILRFFRNILSAPRAHVGADISSRDRGVHLGIVGALARADLYTTLSILFSTSEDAASQFSDLVFLVADIYAQTFRHTGPQQIYHSFKIASRDTKVIQLETEQPENEELVPQKKSVFDETPEDDRPEPQPVRQASESLGRRRSAKSSLLRAAIQKERAFIGGSRAISKSTRWTSRHSGGFSKSTRKSSEAMDKPQNADNQTHRDSSKSTNASRIVSARNAIHSKISLNPNVKLQDAVKLNSDLLCLQVAKGRTRVMKKDSQKTVSSATMRKDLQHDGLKAIGRLTAEFIQECGAYFLKELRGRIEDLKSSPPTEDLRSAQRAFLSIVGSIVGFQRERYGKSSSTSVATLHNNEEFHINDMKAILGSDLKKVKKEWKQVEAAMDIESFRLVFRLLIEACDCVKGSVKEELKPADVELATFAVLHMMKMLQAMTVKEPGETFNEDSELGPREIALNTIEGLFENEAYLNAPAELAKEYNAKIFSFEHLTNIVEVTHAFTTILLDEKELAHIQVTRKKRRKRAKAEKDDVSKGSANAENPSSAAEQKDIPRSEKGGKDSETGASGPHQPRPERGEGSEAQTGNARDSRPEITTDRSNKEKEAADGETPANGVVDEAETNQIENPSAAPDGSIPRLPDSEETNLEAENSSHSDLCSDDDQDVNLPQMREIESTGIIRRFAHWKALQSLFLPVRATLCHAVGLTGSMKNIPEGSSALQSPLIVAKSAHVLSAVWRVAKEQERGALCGQFFTFATMHMLSTIVQASKREIVSEISVLASLSEFAKDATHVFFTWLQICPGLALDLFFPMEKRSCLAYVSALRQQALKSAEKVAGEDSGNDSDLSDLIVERNSLDVEQESEGDIEFERNERLAAERMERKSRKERTQYRKKVAERRRKRRKLIEEDEDVDVDELDFGIQAPSGKHDIASV